MNGDQFDTYKYKLGVTGPYHQVAEFLTNVGIAPAHRRADQPVSLTPTTRSGERQAAQGRAVHRRQVRRPDVRRAHAAPQLARPRRRVHRDARDPSRASDAASDARSSDALAVTATCASAQAGLSPRPSPPRRVRRTRRPSTSRTNSAPTRRSPTRRRSTVRAAAAPAARREAARHAAEQRQAGGARPRMPATQARSRSSTIRPRRHAGPPPTIYREIVRRIRADGRRDPFVSLLTTNELRPAMSDLRLTGVLFDHSGRTLASRRFAISAPTRSIASTAGSRARTHARLGDPPQDGRVHDR